MVVVCLRGPGGRRPGPEPAELRRLAPHAAEGLAVGLGVGVVLLAWPVWFALEGPAHLSGLVWPNLAEIGGYIPSDFVSTHVPARGTDLYLALGGYEGAPLGSSTYLGWGLLAVLAVGVAAFWRDRRLWFFGFLFVLCVVLLDRAIAAGQWVPAQLFASCPCSRT